MEGYLEGGSEEKAAKKKKKQSSGYEFAGENGFAEFVIFFPLSSST